MDIPQSVLNTNKVKEITLSDIPAGVTPIVVKNNDELNSLIKKLDNAKCIKYCSKVKNSSNQQVRFKSNTVESLDYLTFGVSVRANYLNYGDNVTFSVYFSGFHPGVEISDVTSAYHWHDRHYLDYEVNYSLDAYINLGGKWVYYSSPHTVKEDNVYVY